MVMYTESEERQLLLARVASLYYDSGMNQQQIADTLEVSRSAISRFLTEARERGIVEIFIHYPWRTVGGLEEKLKTGFGLEGVRVLAREGRSYEEMLQNLGTLAAEELEKRLQPKMRIGIAWGTALYQLTRFVRPHRLPGIEVVQMIGATGSDQEMSTDGPILAQLLAGRLGGGYRHLHAPLILESAEAHSALLRDKNITETLTRAASADIAIIGIGSTRPGLYSILRAGYVNEVETVEIRKQGAIGDICGKHFDIQGNELDIDISRRSIGIQLQTLKRVPLVMGIAGGEEKGDAVLGALRGGFVNILITDDSAAEWIVEAIGSDG